MLSGDMEEKPAGYLRDNVPSEVWAILIYLRNSGKAHMKWCEGGEYSWR